MNSRVLQITLNKLAEENKKDSLRRQAINFVTSRDGTENDVKRRHAVIDDYSDIKDYDKLKIHAGALGGLIAGALATAAAGKYVGRGIGKGLKSTLGYTNDSIIQSSESFGKNIGGLIGGYFGTPIGRKLLAGKENSKKQEAMEKVMEQAMYISHRDTIPQIALSIPDYI